MRDSQDAGGVPRGSAGLRGRQGTRYRTTQASGGSPGKGFEFYSKCEEKTLESCGREVA